MGDDAIVRPYSILGGAIQDENPAEAICPYCSGRGMAYMRWSGWYAEFPSLCGCCGGSGMAPAVAPVAKQERG